jgi:ABC-type multidrug transport system permease subunit
MSKILGGAAIGFLVCSLLAFFVVAAVFSSSDNADTRSLGLFAAMMYSPLAGFMGAVIGATKWLPLQ